MVKHLLIYILLFLVCWSGVVLADSVPPLSMEDKSRITQALLDALQAKDITKQQYTKQVEWVNSTPCEGVDRLILARKNKKLSSAIAKQLKLSTVDVLQFYKADGWSFIYVDTHVSDATYLFYSGDPLTATHPVTQWSGAAMIIETTEIEQWLLKNAPSIPKHLARCFAWHVTLNRD
jgi:hypothetical protein